MKGVTFDTKNARWRAAWRENGKKYEKSFAIAKYGFDTAKEYARENYVSVKNGTS